MPSDPWTALAERLLGPAELTAAEVSERTGVDPEQARLLWRALGFPPVGDDERVFTRADVEVLAAVRELVEVHTTDPDTLIQLTRVVGQSLARIADAQLTATLSRLEELRGRDGLDDATIAALVERIEALTPRLEQSLGYVWRRHLIAALRRAAVQPSAAEHTLSVGFADLVGFTTLSQALEPSALAAMVDRFESLAYDHIPALGGRVVKLIGDEVMFAATAPAAAAEIALALSEAHAADSELPDLRVGLACGPVLSWEGDLYGPTVNLASRLVNLARPGTGLASVEIAAARRDAPRFYFRPLRPLALKGFGRVRVYALRRGR